jgi:hypothetical protein
MAGVWQLLLLECSWMCLHHHVTHITLTCRLLFIHTLHLPLYQATSRGACCTNQRQHLLLQPHCSEHTLMLPSADRLYPASAAVSGRIPWGLLHNTKAAAAAAAAS